jgi:hypothetical protein
VIVAMLCATVSCSSRAMRSRSSAMIRQAASLNLHDGTLLTASRYAMTGLGGIPPPAPAGAGGRLGCRPDAENKMPRLAGLRQPARRASRLT